MELELYRADATLTNVLSGMGTEEDKSQFTAPSLGARFADETLEVLYENLTLNAFCNALPDAAISKPWDFNFGQDFDPEEKNKIKDWIDEFERDQYSIPEMTAKAQKIANVYGGSAIVWVVDDGKPQSEPLDIDKVKRLVGVRVISKRYIRPIYTGASTLEDIVHYEITDPYSRLETPDGQPLSYVKIHKTRVIPFYGLILTDEAMFQRYEGWGKSLIEAIWEAWRDYKVALASISGALYDASLTTVETQGFIDMLRTNETETVRKIFSTFRKMATMFKMVAIDKDRQSIQNMERKFQGVDEIVDRLRDEFIGQSRIPHDKLFGETPSGLGATGESEEKNWAKEVRQFQEFRLRRRIEAQYSLVFSLNKKLFKGGKVPATWKIVFPSILEQTQEQELSTRATQANIDSIYIRDGVVIKEEVRQSRFGSSEFSYEMTLDDELFEEEKKKLEQQESSGFGLNGFTGFGEDEVVEPEEQEAVEPDEGIGGLEDFDFSTDSVRTDAMRSACLECVNKHLGNALVLGREFENGYPTHYTLMIGHLDQAAAEVEAYDRDVAGYLRVVRLQCEQERRSIYQSEVENALSSLGFDYGVQPQDDQEGIGLDGADFGGFSRSLEHQDAYYEEVYNEDSEQYKGIDFNPPESVRNAAKRGLEIRRSQPESKKGGLTNKEASKEGIGSGVQRARNLANGDRVSPKVIRQMVRFFDRHQAFKGKHKEEPEGKARQSWLLWGGDAGRAWANKILKQMDKADEKKVTDSLSPEELEGYEWASGHWRGDSWVSGYLRKSKSLKKKDLKLDADNDDYEQYLDLQAGEIQVALNDWIRIIEEAAQKSGNYESLLSSLGDLAEGMQVGDFHAPMYRSMMLSYFLGLSGEIGDVSVTQ